MQVIGIGNTNASERADGQLLKKVAGADRILLTQTR
jgi:hypothetical protein